MNKALTGINGGNLFISDRRRLGLALAFSVVIHAVIFGVLTVPPFASDSGRHPLTVKLSLGKETSAEQNAIDDGKLFTSHPNISKLPGALPVLAYLPSSELTIPPYFLTDINLDGLTPLALGAGGKATFELWINKFGRVDRVDLLESSLNPNYTDSVISVLRQAPFEAGQWRGHQVGSIIKLEMSVTP